MTEYKHRISYSVMADDIDAANEFMAWIGVPANRHTFRLGVSEFGAPPTVAVASGVYKEDHLVKLATAPTEDTRPAWDTEAELDLALAQQGQALFSFELDELAPSTNDLMGKAKAGKIVAPLKGVASGDTEEWEPDVSLAVGNLRTYNGTTYLCIQAHTTQADWTPNVVPALFAVIADGSGEWQVGVQYGVDDITSYEGLDYSCLQAHTSQVGWEPPNVPALWVPLPGGVSDPDECEKDTP